jgi:hypothetical protein
MNIVPVASGDMTAVIFLHSGKAVVPQKGVFVFHSFMASTHAFKAGKKKNLENLQWEALTCLEIIVVDDFRLNMKFQRPAKFGLVFIEFRNRPWERLGIHHMVLRLQRFCRRVRLRARRLALSMALHPRLGANSPIVEEIVANMVIFSLI